MKLWDGLLIFGLAIALLAAPCGVEAQPANKVPHVGLLVSFSGPRVATFRQALRERGYVEGRTVTITTRESKGNDDRFPALAAELVQLKVDVIVGWFDAATLAARAATTTIPIVFFVSDALRIGLVSRLAAPGGNFTGVSANSDGFTGKQLELLREMVPSATHMAVLTKPASHHDYYLAETRAAAEKLNLRLLILKASTVEEIDRAFKEASHAGVDGVHVYHHVLFFVNRERIAGLAKSLRLPTMYASIPNVSAGGLIAYAPNLDDLSHRLADRVEKVLKGARPGDLPVEQSTKYDLVINQRTAREIGLAIPPSVLLRATQVVE